MDNIKILEFQIKRIFVEVVENHAIQEKQADIYRDRYNLLEAIKIMASSITSAGIISVIFIEGFPLKLLTAVISLLSIFINSYFKVYDLRGLADGHKSSALKLIKLRETIISLLCDIKMNRVSEDEIIEKRDIILNELMGVYDHTKDAETKAVDRANKHLKEREDNTYYSYSDEDIESYLPVFLRNHELRSSE